MAYPISYHNFTFTLLTQAFLAVDLPMIMDTAVQINKLTKVFENPGAWRFRAKKEPRILFLDEPTRSLDPIATKQVHALILRLMIRHEMTIY